MFFKIKKSDKNNKDVSEVLDKDGKFKGKPTENKPAKNKPDVKYNNSNILIKLIKSFKKPSHEKINKLEMEKKVPDNKPVETKSKFSNIFDKFSLKKNSDHKPLCTPTVFTPHSFQTITLQELERRTTWKERKDMKYVTHISTLDSLHQTLSKEYLLLENKGNSVVKYKTEYWDTSGHDMFYQHQSDSAHRYKIRKRQYGNENGYWMEVKEKKNGKTIKYRLPNPSPSETETFISTNTPYKQSDLNSTVFIYYERMTFVHKNLPMKITIDKNMKAGNNHRSVPFDNVAIIEIKTEKNISDSRIVHIIESQGTKPCSVSKYCVGMATLHPELKQNIVKHKSTLLEINKISKKW